MGIRDWWTRFRAANTPRVLCYVNHFYGESPGFSGKSNTQVEDVRKDYVMQVIAALKQIPLSVVRVCGIPGHALLPLDIEFSSLSNPCHLVYASIEHMAKSVSGYDYFVNIEDDILLEQHVFSEIVQFDRLHMLSECLLPNRMERVGTTKSCVDLKANPGWTETSMQYKGVQLRIANNPHSGLFVLSRAKFLYAMQRVDLSKREIVVGGFMASAYANIHSAFSLFRPFEPLNFATVEHLDNWADPYQVN